MLKHISPTLIVLTGLLAICLLTFYQPLFSGEIVNATDILTQQYFWNVFIKENLLQDPSFKTWLPYINAGTPFSGGLDLIFRPVTFLTLLLFPPHIGINYEMVIYFFLSGVFMFFYMRELKLSLLPSFLAALVLMLNGEIVSLMNAGHVNKIGAIFLVPLVFWMLERALQRKTVQVFLALGAALGFQFWQGHIQISFYTCIGVAIYFLVRVGLMFWQERDGKQIGKLVVFGLVMVVVFLALSAVNFLPLLSFAQVSERAQGVSYEFATSWSMPPEELVTYLIPRFFGFRRLNYMEDEHIVEYWGRMPFTQTGRYFGLLPLLLMLLALCFVRNKHILTLAVLALVVLLFGMGRYIPLYKLLYHYVPGFNMFRVPQMILFLFAFATSGLVGFGAEWLFSDFTAAKTKCLRIFLIGLIILCILSWLMVTILPELQAAIISHFQTAFFRKDGNQQIASARFQNIVQGWQVFNLLFGIAIVLLSVRLSRRFHLKWALPAIVGMFLFDIWLFNAKYIDTIPLAGSIYTHDNDTIKYCKAHPGLYRILPLADVPETYRVSNKYLIYKIFSVSGYEAVGVQYYSDYLQHLAFGTSLVDLLNIRYIILPKEVKIDNQAAEEGKMFGPYKVVMKSDAVLLENFNYLPRAFPVHNVYVLKTRDEILSALLHSAFNPREYVILEEVPHAPMSSENPPSSTSKAEITYYLNRTIQMKASMATDGFLVLSEKYYPGWNAYVDGRQTKIYKANYTLQAIYVPRGEHAIIFAYQPKEFLLGFGMTVMTGIGLLGFAFYKQKSQGRLFAVIQAKSKRLYQSIRPTYYSKTLLWGLMCIGILLHTIQYTFNRSLNVDEGGMAVTILDKSYSEILPPFSAQEPVDYNHTTPPGFLLVTKLLVTVFGNSEYVLRFFAFFSGILSLFLFLRVLPYFLKPFAIPLTFGLFVVSDQLIYWSSSLKQFSSDVFITLLLYVITIEILSMRITIRRTCLFGLIGALAVWTSHPSILVLAGIGTCLTIACLMRKEWEKFFHLSSAVLLWLISFAALYVLSFRNITDKAPLQQFWEGAFFSFPLSIAEIIRPIQFFVEFSGYAIGLSQAIFNRIVSHSVFRLMTIVTHLLKSPEEPLSRGINLTLFGVTWSYLYFIAALLAFLGGITLFFRDKNKFCLLVSPVFFAYIACVLHKFPFAQRLLLFLIPATLIFIGEGMTRIKEKTNLLTSVFLIGSLVLYPIGSACYYLIKPRIDQEIKPVIQYVKDRQQAGDTLYIYYGAKPAFTYYARRFGFDPKDYIIGVSSRSNWDPYVQDLNQLRGNKRIWILFSHVFGNEDLFFLQYLDSIGGRRLDSFKGIKASVYLYDLRLKQP